MTNEQTVYCAIRAICDEKRGRRHPVAAELHEIERYLKGIVGHTELRNALNELVRTNRVSFHKTINTYSFKPL